MKNNIFQIFLNVVFNILTPLFIIFTSCKTSSQNVENKKNDKSFCVSKLDDLTKINASNKLNSDVIKDLTKFTDYNLGKSINSATGNVQSILLKYEGKNDEVNTLSQPSVNYYLESVTDLQDLISKFNISADLSVKYFGFSGSFHYDEQRSLNIHSYHEYIVARVLVVDRTESLKHQYLTDTVKENAKYKSNFISKYGDEVITSRQIGGDLFAIIDFETNSIEEKDDLHIVASASVGSFKSGGNMGKSLDNLKVKCTLKIQVIENGSIDATKFSDIPSLKQYIDNFPTLVHNQGKIIKYNTSPIYGVEDLPINFNPTDFNVIKNQKRVLENLESKMEEIVSRMPDLDFIISNPDFFTNIDVDSAKKLRMINLYAYNIYNHNWSIIATDPSEETCTACNQFNYSVPNFQPEPRYSFLKFWELGDWYPNNRVNPAKTNKPITINQLNSKIQKLKPNTKMLLKGKLEIIFDQTPPNTYLNLVVWINNNFIKKDPERLITEKYVSIKEFIDKNYIITIDHHVTSNEDGDVVLEFSTLLWGHENDDVRWSFGKNTKLFIVPIE